MSSYLSLILHAPSAVADSVLADKPEEILAYGLVPSNATPKALAKFAARSVKHAEVAYTSSDNQEFLAKAIRSEKRSTALLFLLDARLTSDEDWFTLVDRVAELKVTLPITVLQPVSRVVAAWVRHPELAGNLGRFTFAQRVMLEPDGQSHIEQALALPNAVAEAASTLRTASVANQLFGPARMLELVPEGFSDAFRDQVPFTLIAMKAWLDGLTPPGHQTWLNGDDALAAFDMDQVRTRVITSLSFATVNVGRTGLESLATERGIQGLSWGASIPRGVFKSSSDPQGLLELAMPDLSECSRLTVTQVKDLLVAVSDTLGTAGNEFRPVLQDAAWKLTVRLLDDRSWNALAESVLTDEASLRLLHTMDDEQITDFGEALVSYHFTGRDWNTRISGLLPGYALATQLTLPDLNKVQTVDVSAVVTAHLELMDVPAEVVNDRMLWVTLENFAKTLDLPLTEAVDAACVVLAG